MKKVISEYEFDVIHKGKKKIVQQSAFSANDAKFRIHSKLPDAEIGKMRKKLTYPHYEGGKKVG